MNENNKCELHRWRQCSNDCAESVDISLIEMIIVEQAEFR